VALSRRLVVLGLAALPAACASPNPVLYVLAPLPGPTRAGAPRNIEVRAVSIARYLERSQIVRSSEGYRMDVLANDWWGEPLDAMINRIMVEELGQRLPGSIVYGDNSAISVPSDATVEINLQRFDGDRDGDILLTGLVAIDGRKTASRNVSFTVRPPDPLTKGLVAAMSTATADLSDTIAAMLTGN
jgi:uncharacterized lipoprotein YmbA